jgi:chorismate mutase
VHGVLEHLTNREVEKAVLRRAFVKASHYGMDIMGRGGGIGGGASNPSPATITINNSSMEGGSSPKSLKIDPMLIADIYRDMIIPLTKDVEIRYIFRRLNQRPPTPDTYYHLCRGPMDAFDGYEKLRNMNASAISDSYREFFSPS